MRTNAAAVILCAVVLLAGPVYAQSDFSAVRLKPGDVVYVTPPSGPEVTGRVTFVSPASIQVDGVEFKPEPGLQIRRRGDRVWDGALSGLVLGVVVQLVAGGECEVRRSSGECLAAAVIWGSGLGALIDGLHVGRTTVYVGTPAAPAASPRPVAGRPASAPTLGLRWTF